VVSANNIVRGTNELLTTSKTILERVDEVRFKERFDEVEILGMESVENDKTILNGIEDTKNSAETIQESANNIVRGTNELLTTSKTILERVDEIGFKERFDEVEKLGTESVENDKTILNGIEDTKDSAKTIQESANNIVRGTNELLTTSKTILERISEVRFKERFDEVEKLGMESVENDKMILNGIEDTKNSAETIQESANSIVRGTNELLTTSKTILERISEVRFKERFDEVEKLGMESVENDKTILNRIGRLEKRNLRLNIGIIGLLILQVTTLVFLFLK
jgi:heme exporter protein D